MTLRIKSAFIFIKATFDPVSVSMHKCVDNLLITICIHLKIKREWYYVPRHLKPITQFWHKVARINNCIWKKIRFPKRFGHVAGHGDLLETSKKLHSTIWKAAEVCVKVKLYLVPSLLFSYMITRFQMNLISFNYECLGIKLLENQPIHPCGSYYIAYYFQRRFEVHMQGKTQKDPEIWHCVKTWKCCFDVMQWCLWHVFC